jgi:hypothetical protein
MAGRKGLKATEGGERCINKSNGEFLLYIIMEQGQYLFIE